MSKQRELDILLKDNGIDITNWTAWPEDVDDLVKYLSSVGIAVKKRQFSYCG